MASSSIIHKCIVPTCKNNSKDNPELKFLYVPRNGCRREVWARTLNVPMLSSDKSLVCCEQHFDLPNDASNWMHFKMMGTKIYLKPDVVPHLNLVESICPKSQLSESDKKRKLALQHAWNMSRNKLVFIDEEYLESMGPLDNSSATTSSSSLQPEECAAPEETEVCSSEQEQEIDYDKIYQKSQLVTNVLTIQENPRFYLGLEINEICAVCNKKFKNSTSDKILITRSLTKPEFDPVEAYQVLESISKFRYSQDGPQHLCGNCYHNTVMAFQFQRICNRAQANFEAWKDHQDKVVSRVKENKEDTTSSKNTKVKQAKQVFLKDLYKGEKLFEEITEVPKSTKKARKQSRNVRCLKCGDLVTYVNFRYHLFKHTGVKPFKCQHCDAAYCYPRDLSDHVNEVHENRRDFICYKCGKAFLNSSRLARHERSHSGIKPFKCKNCDKAYRTRPDLIEHMRCHTAERPFNCEYCGKTYRTIRHFRVHLQNHNKTEKTQICQICGKAFSRPKSLRLHQLRVHDSQQAFRVEDVENEERQEEEEC